MNLSSIGAVAVFAFSSLFGSSAGVADTTARFCVVPVKGLGPNRLIGRSPRRIDALPSVVFTTLASKDSRWTIDADRRLVPYSGPYPVTYLDDNHNPNHPDGFIFHDYWTTEPWSSRIVATSWGNGAVSIIQPGSHVFQRINENDKRANYDGPFLLPRQHTTIVTNNSSAYVVGDKSLTPWKSRDELAKYGLDGIIALYDAPSLTATIMIDRHKAIFAVADSGESQQVGSLVDFDFGNVFDSPYARATLFVAQKSVRLIRKASDGNTVGFSSKTLIASSSNGADRYYFYSRKFGQVLAHETGGFSDLIAHWRISDLASSWRRLGPNGFEAIPGGDDPRATPTLVNGSQRVGWKAKDLKALGLTLLDGAGGYFLYDGEKIVAVIDGEHAKIGQSPRIYDLPLIGRVFVRTESGLKELRDSRLLDLPAAFPASILTISEWPESKSVVLFTAAGAYVVDKELSLTPVAGSAGIGFESSVSGATNPSTGELVFTGKQDTYLLVDTDRSGKEVCYPS
jgi:hypothetical protein